ncbi:hypothetical protein [Methylobacterium sp. P5_C11]
MIAAAYHRDAQGDAWAALVAAIADALVDLDAMEQHFARQGRLISRGYACGWPGTRASQEPHPSGARPQSGPAVEGRSDVAAVPKRQAAAPA